MSDERFEHDLHAVLEALAPRDVPAELRAAVAAVPLRPARRRGRWQPRLLAAAAAIVILAAAVLVAILARPAVEPGVALPTPRSALVSGFVEQTDGLFGYRMLRPANWTPGGSGLPMGRAYVAPGFEGSQVQGIAMTVVNLRVAGEAAGPNGVIGDWFLFQQHPTLAGWTAAIEAGWRRDGWGFTLLRSLPDAKIYALTSLGGKPTPLLVLSAYAIEQGQPFLLQLQGSGTYRDVTRLEKDGVIDDVATMVVSIQAVPPDARNVVPPLPTPASPAPYQPTAPAGPSPVASFALPASLGAFTTPLPPAAGVPWTAIRWTRLAAGDPLSQVRSVVRWSGGFLALGLDQPGPSGWWTPLWRSSDGADWQPVGPVFGTHALVLGLATAGGQLVALTAAGGTAACPPSMCGSLYGPITSWTSADGLTWSAHVGPDLPLPPDGEPHVSLAGGPAGLVVAFAPVSGGADLTARVATSPDGVAWSLLPSGALPPNALLWDVHPTTSGFVAAGRVWPAGGSITGSLALTSRDGRTWTSTPLPVAADRVALVEGLLQGAGGFLATGSDYGLPGTSLWWRSADGHAWQALAGYPPLGTCAPDICLGTEPDGDLGADGTRMVTYRGGTDPGVWTSVDGGSWTRLTELGTPLSVFQAGGELVVLPGGVLLTDGSTTWFGQAQAR
jgi:hypothetical protein